jgi:hypothetical protein
VKTHQVMIKVKSSVTKENDSSKQIGLETGIINSFKSYL